MIQICSRFTRVMRWLFPIADFLEFAAFIGSRAFIGFVAIVGLTTATSAIEADTASLRSIRIDGGATVMRSDENCKVLFRGSDARHQCLVTGTDVNGLDIDVTREAQFTLVPDGIVSIDRYGVRSLRSRTEPLVLPQVSMVLRLRHWTSK